MDITPNGHGPVSARAAAPSTHGGGRKTSILKAVPKAGVLKKPGQDLERPATKGYSLQVCFLFQYLHVGGKEPLWLRCLNASHIRWQPQAVSYAWLPTSCPCVSWPHASLPSPRPAMH